jgi:hypothetical protein
MSDDVRKIYISAGKMEKDCWEFAAKLYRQGYDPDFIIGVTRGGAQISIYMQEAFCVLSGEKKIYTTVQAVSYTGISEAGDVVVENVDAVLRRVEDGQKLLVVDDVFDRGKTLKAVKETLVREIPVEIPEIRLAALYYKPENNEVDIVPDFYFQTFESKEWVVLPHELQGLTAEELCEKGFTYF